MAERTRAEQELRAAQDELIQASKLAALGQMAAGQKIDPALWDEFVAAQNDALATGPKVSERVPDFTLSDQNGKAWPLRELMGPNGLLLVFVRSADW